MKPIHVQLHITNGGMSWKLRDDRGFELHVVQLTKTRYTRCREQRGESRSERCSEAMGSSPLMSRKIDHPCTVLSNQLDDFVAQHL